jgi:hypothetical protein
MSIGTILLIILVIALLGGFSGLWGWPLLWDRLLRRRRTRPRANYRVDLGFAWQALNNAAGSPMAVAVARLLQSGNGKHIDVEVTLRSFVRLIEQAVPSAILLPMLFPAGSYTVVPSTRSLSISGYQSQGRSPLQFPPR